MTTRVAIVGSRCLAGNRAAEVAVRTAVADLRIRFGAIEIVSGGAVGVDQMAEAVARELGIPVRVFRPTMPGWNVPGGYRDRNKQIADYCSRLLRVYCPHSTFGSGWTEMTAKRLGRVILPAVEIVCASHVRRSA
jgi:nucleoside-diphosphate-sugar epimerase